MCLELGAYLAAMSRSSRNGLRLTHLSMLILWGCRHVLMLGVDAI